MLALAFHQDHVCFRRAMAQFSWLAIFFAVQPFLSACHVFELQDDDALRMPVAFQRFRLRRRGQCICRRIFLRLRRPDSLFFVTDRIRYFDFDNNVGCHDLLTYFERASLQMLVTND